MDAVIELYKKDVDRTLIAANLRLTPDQRVRKLVELVNAMEALRTAPRKRPDGYSV
ncbi:MAG: hypothetical protein AAFX94_06080 [Myxococcota bacterium]